MRRIVFVYRCCNNKREKKTIFYNSGIAFDFTLKKKRKSSLLLVAWYRRDYNQPGYERDRISGTQRYKKHVTGGVKKMEEGFACQASSTLRGKGIYHLPTNLKGGCVVLARHENESTRQMDRVGVCWCNFSLTPKA